ncbi:MAG: hypothetical protein P8H03_05265, partial [Emcibacteraceae bacterium]|nr:hypothetical protein [Emcibacteraceae bacterium]
MSISSLSSQTSAQKLNLSKLSKTLLLGITMGSFTCLSAYSQVTLTGEITDTLKTSTVDGGNPDSIIVDEDGQIILTSGTAITIDSNHDVTVDGTLSNTVFSNGVGVHFTTVNGETLMSTLNINDRMQIGQADDDDNIGTNNYGILVDGEGTLQGDIILGGSSILDVIGTNSVGVSIQTEVDGSIEVNAVGVNGDNGTAVEILAAVSGDILSKASIEAGSAGTHGMYIGADVAGSYRNRGSYITGRDESFNFSTRTTTPAVAGIASVRIAANLGGGFSNEIAYFDSNGNEVDRNENQSVAGLSSDTSSILSYGGGYGVWISPEKIDGTATSNITIGNTGYSTVGINGSTYEDYSIVNQGSIRVEGTNDGAAATAIYISGTVSGVNTYTTTLDEGIYNGLWGTIESNAINATATAIRIGDHAIVPEFVSNGGITVSTNYDVNTSNETVGSGGDAYGLIVDANAELGRFESNGSFRVTAVGPTSSAYGLVDHSGTVTEFINTNFFH